MRQALALCSAGGGKMLGSGGAMSDHIPDEGSQRFTRSGGKGEREGVAGKWGSGFMQGGYLGTLSSVRGYLVNTFETAITWDRFPAFHRAVIAAVREAIAEVCPSGGDVTCRFTHVYPDGPVCSHLAVHSFCIRTLWAHLLFTSLCSHLLFTGALLLGSGDGRRRTRWAGPASGAVRA